MSAPGRYSNDPRVKACEDGSFEVDNSEQAPHGFEWPVTVRLHCSDRWAIYEPSRAWHGYSVAGFRSEDSALRYLLGDPR